jgi:SulP family sulfate permease
MDRILRGRAVEMVLSGLSMTGEIGQSLAMVGLLEETSNEKVSPPRIFENLNQALEACENQLLLAFKQRSEHVAAQHVSADNPTSMSIPKLNGGSLGAETMYNSPRRSHVQHAAATTLKEHELTVPAKWQNFAQPLPLILQAFKDLTGKDMDFWHRAVPFFQRREYVAGAVLYSRGDLPDGFYLLEEGILRAEYDFEQGAYYESIVAGTTCGELPFFTDTDRTSTVVAEKDCVAWLLTKERWRELEDKMPDVATELLKIGLKLTSERMNSITS